MYETLEVGVQDGIGTLWLNRPEKLNALSRQTLRDLADAARWFNENREARVVIVGGKGKAFSSGADLSGFPNASEGGAREAADTGRIMAEAIEDMSALTIARIQGWKDLLQHHPFEFVPVRTFVQRNRVQDSCSRRDLFCRFLFFHYLISIVVFAICYYTTIHGSPL